MNYVINPIILWKFGRPHTLIGTVVSITCLFIVATHQMSNWQPYFFWSLLSAVACNIFITGYNQLVDVELDRINKPELPLPSGEISYSAARNICIAAFVIALASAAIVSMFLLCLILLIAGIGFLYSWKKTYLKRSHPLAAGSIIAVRGILVNIGFYIVFSQTTWAEPIPNEIWLLTIFVSCFSLGIAWFKDIPDVKGDLGASIGSLAIKWGVGQAFQMGFIVVSTGYLITALAPNLLEFYNFNTGMLAIGSALTGLIFLSISFRVEPLSQNSMARFYKHFWQLFAAGYVLFAAASLPL